MKIGTFKLIDRGIREFKDNGSMDFENAAAGVGENAMEAIEDCLVQMRGAGFDIKGMYARILKQEEWKMLPLTNRTGLRYNVSILWNEEK